MSAGISLVKNTVDERLKEMLTRAQSSKAWARVYPLYQKLQTQRFMTQNASEGAPWHELQPKYAQRKLTRYSAFPGGGRKMLIGTSTLAGAAIGPGAPFEGTGLQRALFSAGSMRIDLDISGVNAEGKPFTYPMYVAEKRPFMSFSEKSLDEMKDALKNFMIGDS